MAVLRPASANAATEAVAILLEQPRPCADSPLHGPGLAIECGINRIEFMKCSMNHSGWVAGFAAMTLLGSGCQSGKVTHYTSPQVTGRVLAADTHQPLAGTRVRRVVPNQVTDNVSGPVHGSQQMVQPGPAWTGADGRFVLDSQRVFALFQSPGWLSVSVAYSHSGYATFQTNYTDINVTTNTAGGAPVVNAGDVQLQPLAR